MSMAAWRQGQMGWIACALFQGYHGTMAWSDAWSAVIGAAIVWAVVEVVRLGTHLRWAK